MTDNNFLRADFMAQNGPQQQGTHFQSPSFPPFVHSFEHSGSGPTHDTPRGRDSSNPNSYSYSYSSRNGPPPAPPNYQCHPSTLTSFQGTERWLPNSRGVNSGPHPPFNSGGNFQAPPFPPPTTHYHSPPPLPPPPHPFLMVVGANRTQGDFPWGHVDARDPSSHVLPSVDQEQETKNEVEEFDENWLQNWITDVERRRLNSKKKQRKEAPRLKISDIQAKLLHYASLVAQLEDLLRRMMIDASPSDEEDQSHRQTWNSLRTKSEGLKEEIRAAKRFFGADNIGLIKETVMKRREKRSRERKVKKMKNQLRRQTKERWREKEREIDLHLLQLHQQQRAKIEEEKMKKEADSVLREVRTKQEEARRMQTLLTGLAKLRDARLTKGEVHGHVTTTHATHFFHKIQVEFGKVIECQLSHYCDEEQTLKVMMEESTNPLSQSKKKSVDRLRKSTADSVDKLKRAMHELPFGKDDVGSAKIENEFLRSFTSADESVEILVKRRSDWDQFITTGDDPGSSSVPLGWVLPSIDPNSDWKIFQNS